MISSDLYEDLLSTASGSEEQVGSVDAPGAPHKSTQQSHAIEVLLEVVNWPVENLSLEWPDTGRKQ